MPETPDEWADYDRRAKEIKLKAASFEAKYTSLYNDWMAFEKMLFELYKSIPFRQDVLFFDSPLSSRRFLISMRNNLAKLGWPWAGRFIHGDENLVKFSQAAYEAVTWKNSLASEFARRPTVPASNKEPEPVD